MRLVTAFLAGLVFGVGLLLSGMADPGKVLGFLDLAGAWDPSLIAAVMAGAIGVGAVAVRARAPARHLAAGRRPCNGPRPSASIAASSWAPGVRRRLGPGRLLPGAGAGGAGHGRATRPSCSSAAMLARDGRVRAGRGAGDAADRGGLTRRARSGRPGDPRGRACSTTTRPGGRWPTRHPARRPAGCAGAGPRGPGAAPGRTARRVRPARPAR